ncbi:MAG: hypothetical protein II756_02600 [Clostridia bacterium]|nr:hypothetical protein [Clostridia bacterium]
MLKKAVPDPPEAAFGDLEGITNAWIICGKNPEFFEYTFKYNAKGCSERRVMEGEKSKVWKGKNGVR